MAGISRLYSSEKSLLPLAPAKCFIVRKESSNVTNARQTVTMSVEIDAENETVAVQDGPERYTLSRALFLIMSDHQRTGLRLTWLRMLISLIRIREFRYCVWLRLSSTKSPAIHFFGKIMLRHLSNASGVHIVARSIGPGLYIGHLHGIITSGTCRIGTN
jgi:hypothetical protein